MAFTLGNQYECAHVATHQQFVVFCSGIYTYVVMIPSHMLYEML